MFDEDDDIDDLNDHEHIKELPVFRKAMEIVEITTALVNSAEKEKDKLMLSEFMLSNAYLLPPKVGGAAGVDVFSLRMENAVQIKIAARELLASTSMCKHMKLNHPEHLQILRDEIENFRLLFVDWINTFDSMEDFDDEWGIVFSTKKYS